MVLGVRNTEHRPAIPSEKKHYRAEVCHLDTIFVIGQDLHILHQIEEIHAGYAALPPGSNTSPPWEQALGPTAEEEWLQLGIYMTSLRLTQNCA